MSVDAVDINITGKTDGSGVIEVVVQDDRLEERVQLLRTRGATKHGDTWHLTVDDIGDVAGLASHLLGLIADMLNPAATPDANREAAISRDNDRCRLCGRDFDAVITQSRVSERVLDHMYPKHEAGPANGVHEVYNLITVCRGCDDVFLQGDAFRFIPERIDFSLGPLERQLLAWIQKRGIVRSDWLAHHVTEHRDEPVDHDFVVERLRMFGRLGLLRQFADIGIDQAFEAFGVDLHHHALICLEKAAVNRHHRLPSMLIAQSPGAGETLISMDEKESPDVSAAIGGTTMARTGGDRR